MPTPTRPPRLPDAPTRVAGSGDARPTPEVPPRTVIGGYRVYEQVALGPLGRVYRARHLTADPRNVRFLAFARPPQANADDWPHAARSFSELLARYAALPPHPGIQRPLAWGQEGEVFWVAQEWAEGATLAEFVAAHGPQSLPWAVAVAGQIGAALDTLADAGLWHSDLRPENVLVTRDETADNPYKIRAVLLNAGVAHAAAKFGSPYAAPEQQSPVTGGGDARSDLYALGSLLYFLLAGGPPFRGERPSQIAAAVTSAFPPRLPNVPEPVHGVLAVLLAKHPAQRYGRAAEAVADMANRRAPDAAKYAAGIWGAGGAPLTVPRADLPEREAKAIRRRAFLQLRREQDGRRFARATVVAWAVCGLLFAGIAALLYHAAGVPDSERTLRVLPDGTPRKAPATLSTGRNGALTLATRRSRLRLGPRTRLDLREVAYRDGAVLRATLRAGELTVATAPRVRDDVLEVRAGGARILADGGGRFVATPRLVAVSDGAVRVVAGDTQRRVSGGQQLDLGAIHTNAAGATFVPEPAILGASWRKRLENAPAVPSLWIAAEDRLLVPPVTFVASLGTYTTRVTDDQARARALDSMRTLTTLIEAAKARGRTYPASLDLSTLRGLGAEPDMVKAALAGFSGRRLTAYRRLPGGKGYVAEARAADSGRSLVRGYSGSAYLPGNDDTRLPE
jgi:serine/threonine-protein kinase